MTSEEDAKIIAREYLDKNGYENLSITSVTDKIFKWVVEISNPSHKFRIEINKNGGAVIQYTIDD